MPGKHWNDDEKQALLQQFNHEGREIEEIQINGRSSYAVRSQAIRMGLIDPGQPRLKWPAEQRQRLQRLKQDGFSPSEIYHFNLLGPPFRSLWSITKMWGRMKLANRQRAHKMRHKKVWQPGEKRRFDRYLHKHSHHMTPEQIGKAWGLARSTVARRQTELGLKLSRQQVLDLDYSQAKQRRARRKLRQENLRHWAQRQQRKQAELLELADQLRNGSKNREERTCIDCGRSWPKRREFFHTREKRISIGTSKYYKHRCILCENARRRKLAKAKAKAQSKAKQAGKR